MKTHRLFLPATLVLSLLLTTALLRGQATLVTLHSFRPTVANRGNILEGTSPAAGLVRGADGYFYGVTQSGGGSGQGTIFQITPSGTFTTLYGFSGLDTSNKNSDGARPAAGLFLDGEQKLYGTTTQGGPHAAGTIFKFTPSGTLSVLNSFDSTTGTDPEGALVQATDHNFYGTTANASGSQYGTIYKVTSAGVLTVLHTITDFTEGDSPQAGLVQARDGNLYGTTSGGGGTTGGGTIFRISTVGTFSIIHAFQPGEGVGSTAPLIESREDPTLLYGTTRAGGVPNRDGTVFSVTTGGEVTTLHSFEGNDGADPEGGLVEGSDGNLYGTTSAEDSGGTVFEITPEGGFTTLHTFSSPGSGGSGPIGELVEDTDGTFYGTTNKGGTNGTGTVYRITVAPTITSAQSGQAVLNQPYTYQIVATHAPTTYSSGTLPAGLTLNVSSGVISGTPTQTGKFQFTFSASNAGGTSTAILTLTVVMPPPVITSTTMATATTGTAFSYQITATNSPTKYGASGLPSGLTINQTTGRISGTPTTAGTYNVTIAAFNSAGSGSAKLTLTVKAGAPTITSATTATATGSSAFSYQITATNTPTKYGESGLPSGLAINQTTGKISGAPTRAGTYSVTIAAFNSVGSGSAKLALTVKAGAPTITSATSANASVGNAFSYQITATNSPTKYGESGLPSGLTINQTTGKISGTPTKAGTYTTTIAAFNSVGSGSAKLSLVVGPSVLE